MGKSTLQDVSKISFCVDTLTVKNGKKLAAIRPDQDGYYPIPLAVLGTVTDNRTYYEVEDVIPQITHPESFVNRLLTDGKLYGEYGHPMVRLLPPDLQIPRLMLIDEKNVSHHIKKLWTGDLLESGGRPVYGLVKPTGPYGQNLKANFDDPCMNTSFSLRSIASSRQANGITRRSMQHLVTFDYVLGGGYPEASKRYAPASESFIDIPLEYAQMAVCHAAMESITGAEINDIFGAKMVTIERKRTAVILERNTLRDEDGTERSIFTSLLGSK